METISDYKFYSKLSYLMFPELCDIDFDIELDLIDLELLNSPWYGSYYRLYFRTRED